MSFLKDSIKTEDGKVWTPPSNFSPSGPVKKVQITEQPAYISRALARRKRVSGSKKAGMAFESQVHEQFKKDYPDSYLPSLWFHYYGPTTGARGRFVQPDALHINFDKGLITLFEVKLRHTIRAWWQLKQLYGPVVRRYFGPEWRYDYIEVYKWFDPRQPFPEEIRHVRNPLASTNSLKVMKM